MLYGCVLQEIHGGVLIYEPLPPQLHFEVPLSPVIAPKKARPADTGSDEVSVQNRWTSAC